MFLNSSVVSTSTLLLGLVLGLVGRRGDGDGGEDGDGGGEDGDIGGEDGDVGGLGGDCAFCGGMSFLVEECGGGHSGASLATLRLPVNRAHTSMFCDVSSSTESSDFTGVM